jgi:hypothetical protein
MVLDECIVYMIYLNLVGCLVFTDTGGKYIIDTIKIQEKKLHC